MVSRTSEHPPDVEAESMTTQLMSTDAID